MGACVGDGGPHLNEPMYIPRVLRVDPLSNTVVLLCLATICWCVRVIRRRQGGTVRVPEKSIVVIDFGDAASALALSRAADGFPQLVSIAGRTRYELLQLMQAGIREVLPKLTSSEMVGATHRALVRLTSADECVGQVYSFLPAKPGCGATTIATHANAAAGRLISEPPLLPDYDSRWGVTSFLLKAEGAHSIADALQQTARLDHHLWSNLVSQRDNLHVLGSGPVDFSRLAFPGRFGELPDFAVRKYSRAAVDLPGTMEHYECDTLARSKQIFLVWTSDISALHVARRKSNRLRDLGLAGNGAVILNCVQRRKTLPPATVEIIIQTPIRNPVPAGANEIVRLAQKGETINGSSPLAKQIGRIASDMGRRQAVAPKTESCALLRRISFCQFGARCAEWIKVPPEKQI